jgi:hypothetical protein
MSVGYIGLIYCRMGFFPHNFFRCGNAIARIIFGIFRLMLGE